MQRGPRGDVANTGANAGCISDYGANDMVGNLAEWVGDWDEEGFGGDCSSWPASFGDDLSCVGRGSDDASTRFPGALVRGGGFFIAGGSGAGPFQITTISRPSSSDALIGFRGAR